MAPATGVPKQNIELVSLVDNALLESFVNGQVALSSWVSEVMGDVSPTADERLVFVAPPPAGVTCNFMSWSLKPMAGVQRSLKTDEDIHIAQSIVPIEDSFLEWQCGPRGRFRPACNSSGTGYHPCAATGYVGTAAAAFRASTILKCGNTARTSPSAKSKSDDLAAHVSGAGFIYPAYDKWAPAWDDTAGKRIEAHSAGMLYDLVSARWFWYGGSAKDSHMTSEGVNCYSAHSLAGPWSSHAYGMVLSQLQKQVSAAMGPGPFVLERPKVVYHHARKVCVCWLHLDNSTYTLRHESSSRRSQRGHSSIRCGLTG